MKITIKATNFKLSEPLKKFVLEKIGAIKKYRGDLIIARVELERMTLRQTEKKYRAEATLDAPKNIFRGEATANDMYAAIDLLVPKLTIQIEKAKDKIISKTRGKQRKNKELMQKYS